MTVRPPRFGFIFRMSHLRIESFRPGIRRWYASFTIAPSVHLDDHIRSDERTRSKQIMSDVVARKASGRRAPFGHSFGRFRRYCARLSGHGVCNRERSDKRRRRRSIRENAVRRIRVEHPEHNRKMGQSLPLPLPFPLPPPPELSLRTLTVTAAVEDAYPSLIV